MSHYAPHEKRTLFVYFFIFLLIAVGLSVGGVQSYKNFEKQFLIQEQSQLLAITDLKVKGLVSWRMERLADAEMLHQNADFAELVKAYFENPQNTKAQAQIEVWLQNFKVNNEFDRVRLLDVAGQTRLSAPADGLPPLSAAVANRIPEVLISKKVTMLDFYSREDDQRIRLALLIPIMNIQTEKAIGLVNISIDPNIYLYPYIKEWPSGSTTAETLLVRRDGNDALFLNELRFKSDTALNLRIPLERKDVMAVKAVLGQTGVLEGVDYRSEKVLGALSAIPDSPWFLVARMDIAEVYAPLRTRSWQTFFVVGMAIFLAGAGLTTVWRQQRVQFYRAQAKSADAIRESERQLRESQAVAGLGTYVLDFTFGLWTSSAVLDSIFGIDEKFARTIEGWTGLIHPVDRQLMTDYFTNEVIGKHARFDKEYRIIRQNDQTERWVHGMGELEFDSQGQLAFMLGTIQEITERKRAEDELRQSQENFARAFMSSPTALAITRRADGKFYSVNEAYVRVMGYGTAEILEHTPAEMNIYVNLEERDQLVQQLREQGNVRDYELLVNTKFAEVRTLLVSMEPILYYQEPSIISTFIDITERKNAETKLLHQNKYLTALQETALDLISQLDLKTLLEKIVNRAAQLMDAHSGYLDVVDPVSGQLIPKIGFGALKESLQHPVQLGEGIAGTVWKTEQPLVIDRYDLWGGRIQSFSRSTIGAIIGVPLFSGTKILGVLGVAYDSGSTRVFDQEAVEVLTQFARLASVAIENVRFFEIAQQELNERKQAEEALLISEARYRHTLDAMLEGCQIIGFDWRYLYLNDVADIHNRRPKEELLGKKYMDMWPGIESTNVFAVIRQCMEDRVPQSMENEFTFPAGGKGWFELRIYPVPEGSVILSMDITERKQAEQMIEARLRLIEFSTSHTLDELLVKTLDEVCIMLDSPIGFYHFVESDQKTLSLQAWSTRTMQEYCKVEGKGSHYPIEQAGVWADSLRQRKPIIHNDYASLPPSYKKGLPQGHAALIRELVVPIMREDWVVAILGVGNKTQEYNEKDVDVAAYFADVAWEIAERKRAEKQLAEYTEKLEEMVDERTHELKDAQEKLVRQERLALLGQVAGSMGHELRNPLGVISNAIYYLKVAQPDADDTVKEYLDMIEKEARTSDKIITDLLDFTRIKATDRSPVSVYELIHQTMNRFPAPPSVDVSLNIPADLPSLFVDAQQISQVLGNLTVNACQAMPNGGKLVITAKPSKVDDQTFVSIAVEDNGVGIPPENMRKLFEPLFSTKIKGVGLGLAVSRKLIEANDGYIEVRSESGMGSTFTVYLPMQNGGK